MREHRGMPAAAGKVAATARRERDLPRAVNWTQSGLRRLRRMLLADWRGPRYLAIGAAVLGVTTAITTIYYLNHPQVQVWDDSGSYLEPAQAILDHGHIADPSRLPGYPVLIALLFAFRRDALSLIVHQWTTGGPTSPLLAANGWLAALSVVQAGLFVLAVLETYTIANLIVRRAWIGGAVALLVASNTFMVGYVKVIISESLALWLTTTLVLAVTLYVRWPGRRTLWFAAACLLALVLTRAEWIYLPVALFAYLVLIAARRGTFRRLLPHAFAATVMVYAALGAYVWLNYAQNGYLGVTQVQNINLLGKVMQYHMQDEAPPQYSAVARIVDLYVARGDYNPYDVVDNQPALAQNHWQLAGDYSRAIMKRHPIEFALRSVPVFIQSFGVWGSESQIDSSSRFGSSLLRLEFLSNEVWRSLQYCWWLTFVWLGSSFGLARTACLWSRRWVDSH